MNRIALIIVALLLAPCAQAADAVVAAVKGVVFIHPDGSTDTLHDVRAHGGEEILFGDTVRTGSKGVAQVEIGGDQVVLLAPKSNCRVAGTPEQVVLGVRIGEFLIGIKKALSGRRSFRVVTPTAVAAVRGTLFWGKANAKKTTYAGFGHEVQITGKGKNAETVTLRAGQIVEIEAGKAPTEPKPHDIPRTYLNLFAVKGDLRGVSDLIEEVAAPAQVPETSTATPPGAMPMPGTAPR